MQILIDTRENGERNKVNARKERAYDKSCHFHTKTGYWIINDNSINHNKLLHKFIWESFYKTKTPTGYVIHHINGDKTDNRIQNLQCVSRLVHTSYHNRNCSEETRKKHSKLMKSFWNSNDGEKIKKELTERMTGENNIHWKNYARVIKSGYDRKGRQRYQLRYNGNAIKHSIYKSKLEKQAKNLNMGGSL